MTSNSVAAGGAVATDAVAVSSGAETLVSATDSRTAVPVAKAPSVDTVTLQGKAQNTVKASPKPGDSMAGGRIGSVVFVYNNKGALRIRYMDSKNDLVYQTPPVLLARTADLMMRSGSSVSARV